jgi:PAS domain S-box-containing protein
MVHGALILNVDDNEAGRYGKSRMLRFAGFEVVEAENGADAIKLANAHQPKLILLDVNLPDVSGYEVCRRLKADPNTSRIPVIQMSAAFTRGTDRARGLEGGADAYLVEPVEPEVLQATITTTLRTREAEDVALRATKEWESTFRAISDAIALLDCDGVIQRCNEKFKKLTLRGDCEGITLEAWLLQQDAHVPLLLQELIQTKERRSHEFEIGNKWYQLTVDPVFDGQNHTGGVAIFSDITVRRNAERAIIQARNAAESANAAKDRFLAVLSHELRTPLTPVLMLVDSLRGDETLDEDLRSSLEIIQRNVELEARLIDDLLDLTRIVRGKMSLQFQPVDLEKLTDLAIEITRGDINEKRIELQLELEAKHTTVRGDGARLQQVLWNLIKNAVKFTPAGGKVTIRSSNPDPKHICIEVTDTGIGMETEALRRVFEPFEQADQTITRQYGGLGLGLAISKNIVDLHHGSLTADSDGTGKGATFKLLIPIA